MKMKYFLIGAAAASLLGMGSVLADEGDPTRGQQLAETCMGCHAVEGLRNAYPSYRVPKLGGQTETYLYNSLLAYRDGLREHPTMRAQAASLSEEEMRDIAAFFAQPKN